MMMMGEKCCRGVMDLAQLLLPLLPLVFLINPQSRVTGFVIPSVQRRVGGEILRPWRDCSSSQQPLLTWSRFRIIPTSRPGISRTDTSIDSGTQLFSNAFGGDNAIEIAAAANEGFGVVPMAVLVLVVGFGAWLYIDGAEDRAWKQRRADENARYEQYQADRERLAFIEPREYWNEADLKAYDGTASEDGPILLAADGLVFNVHKGRNFYGPGGEYHLFAGRDATRLLAKTIVREETAEEAGKALTLAERAALAGWMFTIKAKYEVVGRLEGFDPDSTSMTG